MFKLLDTIVEVKQKVDDTLYMSKAVVAPVGHPDAAPNPGWGEDDVLAIFRPLLLSPEVMLELEEEELVLRCRGKSSSKAASLVFAGKEFGKLRSKGNVEDYGGTIHSELEKRGRLGGGGGGGEVGLEDGQLGGGGGGEGGWQGG